MTRTEQDGRNGAGPAIVVGVDGSAISCTALRWAIRQAVRQHGTVTAVIVRHSPQLMPATSMAILPRGELHPEADESTHLARLDAEVQAALAEAGEQVAGAVPVRTRALTGDPAHELARLSETADLLVLGGHSRGPLAELVMGSVTAEALRLARCPVVVIPPRMAVAP